MSKINNALSELADKQRSIAEPLERAEIKEVKKTSVLPWVILLVTASLAVGGWALTMGSASESKNEALQTPVTNQKMEKTPVVSDSVSDITIEAELSVASSPTSKTTVTQAKLYSPEPKVQEAPTVKSNVAKPKPVKTTVAAVPKPAPIIPKKVAANPAPVAQESSSVVQAQPLQELAPLKLAKSSAVKEVVSEAGIQIEQVELSPKELALQAQVRGKKALEANNLDLAIEEYHKALRYFPEGDNIRQQLAALYYGIGDVRMAAELLQKGIQNNPDGETLRVALAKLLLRENQQEAALTALVHLPNSPSLDYLSLRAALAQKVGQNELALDSYQKLVTMDPHSGRWWMGLAIQQERALDFKGAHKSYISAQGKLGLSARSQQFITDRLQLLKSVQGVSDAN
ncbi:tetratricopeptide repeat protein [Vibrio sonorensis]|uniref:tetratricopeptide repeat protein n=1 Tax=Vibrio sonorensis TaxID=1004316 RepID=UPI0008DAD03E|nr:tetratricopeptide repeat protein [Vibrio sonorensis]